VTCRKLQDRGERILMEMLEVERAEATRLLDAADGSVKRALVMGSLGLDHESADRKIEAAGGRIGALVEASKGRTTDE